LFGKRRDENGEAGPYREELTEEHSFDELARRLASGAISRRRALKLLGTAILGAALVPFLPGVAEAAPRCPDSGPGCRAVCPGSNRQCVCIRTIEGRKVCVVPECGDPEIRCQTSQECGEKQVCAKTASKCCDGKVPVCVRRCEVTSARTAQSVSVGAWAKKLRR
jgi:hypothetical protein